MKVEVSGTVVNDLNKKSILYINIYLSYKLTPVMVFKFLYQYSDDVPQHLEITT
jgi:hypothetical protein